MSNFLNIEIRKLNIEDENYPTRLRLALQKSAPKNLYVMGNLELLNDFCIGFCGSRKVSLKGLETARDCAQQAARNGYISVSGNASGVDHEVHFQTLESGGKTVLVLPEGINNFRIKKTLNSVWDWDRTLVISQFEPSAPWGAFRAMIRNQLIIGLSRAMIVIEAGEKGGTLNAGLETLKMGLPLYVAEYQNMSLDAKGNKVLLDMGANKLTKSRTLNRANLKGLFAHIEQKQVFKPNLFQESLF